MKLALAIFRYFPYGGLQRDLLALARAAQARGHEVTVFCGSWQGERPEGVQVRELDRFVWFNTAGVRRFVTAFQREFRHRDFDLLVGFNKMPGLDVYFAGDSCFALKAWLERTWLYRLAPRTRLYLTYEQAVFGDESQTRILSLVDAERQRYTRFYATAPERFHMLPPSVDAGHIRCDFPAQARGHLRVQLGLPARAKIILCIGSGFGTKGVDISIASFAAWVQQHPDQPAALVVVGADNPSRYEAQAKRLGVGARVSFPGARSQIGSLLAAADLLLHPARRELAGNVLIEAMVAGVPVLASQVCGYAPYVTRYKMGELIEAGEAPLAVAQKIEHILSQEPSQWRERAKAFVAAVQPFDRSLRILAYLDQQLRHLRRDDWAYEDGRQHLVLRAELVRAWGDDDLFGVIRNLKGAQVRVLPDRQTLRFELNDRGYYCKWHRGVGWWEIIKNLLQLRAPVLGAANEWHALNKLQALNIPSAEPLAFGEQKQGPARRQSFIVTRELLNTLQLDHYWAAHPPRGRLRRLIVGELARIARELHAAGINHRDLYLCHFMLRESSLAQRLAQGLAPEIFLLDLHRAQLRPQVPQRWLVKDLGALYFSALAAGWRARDVLHFLRAYFEQPLADIWRSQGPLLKRVQRRAERFRRREAGTVKGLLKLNS